MMKEGFTKYGLPKIQNLGLIRPTDSAVVTVDGVTWLQSFIVYETDHTRGKGYLRLKQENGKFERAFTLFLTEWEVKGHEEVNMHQPMHRVADVRLTYLVGSAVCVWSQT